MSNLETTLSRRLFIASSTAALGTIAVLPYMPALHAAEANVFKTIAGDITIHPVSHASFVMNTPVGTIYVDPVGDVEAYAQFPKPDLVLITHHHGDHFKNETLAGIVSDKTKIIANPEVYSKLEGDLKEKASQIANGESAMFNALKVNAIPAYNITEDRLNFHPKGRDNGYVLGFDGFTIYVSGDTEDIPEMRALENIDVAFVCMNLPFTMDAKAAASAVAEFKPKYVYPYHYRGRDGGTQDPAEFANLVNNASEVKQHNWYG